MYISYTYIDAVTKVPVTKAPAQGGPASPEVHDLVFGFALESQYPTSAPIFYGTCRDGTDPLTPGILSVMGEDMYVAARDAEKKAMLSKAKDNAYEVLKQRRKACELKGVAFTSLGEVVFPQRVYIPAEKEDQDRINTVLSSMERWPQIKTVSFKANNNVFIPVSYDQLAQVGLAVAVHVQLSFDNESKHTAAISMLTDIGAVEMYDVNTGWPDN